MCTSAALERQQQFDFQKNGIETMSFETLRRTYKENDIYNNPVQGIYHYQVIQRMTDICEKYNLDYEVEEIFAAQNRNKTQPGVSILPQVEQTHGEKAVEAHILRRIFATIRIKDWETRHTGGHRPVREDMPQPVHPLAGKERVQLRKEQGDDGRGIRDGGRLAGQLRGEHERGHRTDPADETQSSLP